MHSTFKSLGAILYLVGKARKGGHCQDKSPAAKGRRWILGTPHPRGLTVSNDLQEEILQTSKGQDKMAGS
jgi:hypothetical protein